MIKQNIQQILKQEFLKYNLEFSQNKSGREGVNFLIGDNQLYLQSIDLDTTQRSIKIAKQDLGEPNDKLWVTLVLILDNEPISLYMIPSRILTKPDDFVFIENEVSSFPQLSNWETVGSRTPLKAIC